MLKSILLSVLSVIFLLQNSFCQPLGTWRMHFTYRGNVDMRDAGDLVYVAGEQSVFAYNKANGAIDFFDKANVLSDVGVRCIDYNPNGKFLLIAYNNSNIDLLENNTDLYNIPDIRNRVVTGTKTINNICHFGSRFYLATDIGIVAINQQKKEIAETYVIGNSGGNVRIFDVAAGGNQIFAATEEGVKSASLSSPNLQNFATWKTYNSADGLPNGNPAHIVFANNTFYTSINDTVFKFDGTAWQKELFQPGWKVLRLRSHSGKLYILQNKPDNSLAAVLEISASGAALKQEFGNRPINYFTDNNGTIWYSDEWNGLFRNGEPIQPSGLYTKNAFALSIKNDVVWVSGGGTDLSWGPTFNYSGFYVLQNNKWRNFNEYSSPKLNDFPDIVCIAADESGTKAYLGSNLAGMAIVDLEQNTIQQFDKFNSPLTGALGDLQRTKATAIAVDKNKNIWIQNAFSEAPITVLKPDGTWKKFPGYMFGVLAKKLIITSNGYKWFALRPGVMAVFYEGASLDNTSDDVYRIIGTGKGNGGLNNGNVYCMVEDKNGAVWVGTDEGIEIFFCARSILNQNGCDAQRVIVERDGFNGFLFGTEVIRALAVDPANRKWVGTNNGVWLISADGKEELLRFNTENSPLPSNFISDIAVNEKTGEVFFATEGGLASYLGDAIAGGETCSGAFVYPNPVEPEYSGPIAVKNLVDDAYVKITDATGTLVHQGKANGGQMIWDAKTYSGRRVASGIYTVFSANEMGKERCVAKIAIVN